MAKKDANYISAKELRKISKQNRKITNAIEKKRKRKNVPESEYVTTMKNPANVVEFDNVHTYFFTDIGTVKAVNGVSFEVPKGKTVGIVGESGCGKSVTSLSLMQLVQRPQGQTVEGEIRFDSGEKVYNIVNTPMEVMQNIRGGKISMIFQEPMTSLNPVFRIGDQLDEVFELHEKELGKEERKERSIGLLKMDFLGLRTLTVINKAIDMVEANHGVRIDFDTMEMNDEKTYQLLCDGDSIGVFQLESSGLRAIMRAVQPTTLEDVIALVALYRPGPLNSGMADDFIDRKHGRKETEYLHPLLEPILKPTYGVILYQEQVMRIASELAGFSLGQADMLRRAMGKKKPEIIASLKEDFMNGAEQNHVDRAIAAKVFELIEYFAGYGFNKSHSAAYAVVAYQTAYLKAHYPVEFMAALLTSIMDSADRVAFYIAECKRMGIAVLTPDVNESQETFTVTNGCIRFGLAAMKNVGKGAMQSIIEVRKADGPFTSLQDFCARVDLSQVNKRMMENLIKGGAFDSLEGNKQQKLAILDTCLEQGTEIRRSKASAQISLFDFGEETGLTERYAPIPLPPLPEFSSLELLAMEKQILGLYVSGHPLDDYKQVIHEKTSVTLAELTEDYDQQKIIVAGMIENFKISTTKKGDTMATVQFEDLTGSMDMLVFPKTFVRYREMIEKDAIVLVKGRFLAQDDNPKLSADEILPLPNDAVWLEQQKQRAADGNTVSYVNNQRAAQEASQPVHNMPRENMAQPQVASLQEIANKQPKKLYLRIAGSNDTPQVKQKLSQILRRYHGEMPVYFYFSDRKSMVLAEYQYWVNNEIDLIMLLSQLLGAENISVKDTAK